MSNYIYEIEVEASEKFLKQLNKALKMYEATRGNEMRIAEIRQVMYEVSLYLERVTARDMVRLTDEI